MLEKAIDFAKKHGYYTAKEAGTYNGYTVFIPEMKNDNCIIGLPQFILIKGDEIIMHTDVHFKVYDALGLGK